MFDMLISGAAAFNQLIAFGAALLCALLGAVLVGNALYWKLRALRVQGELIGVRQQGKTYRSVYRYTGPDGHSYEGTSNQGSSSLAGRATGASVALLVMPGDLTQVEEARSHAWTLIGIVFLATGSGLFYYAVHMWPIGPATWVVAGLLIVYAAVRIRRVVLRSRTSSLPRNSATMAALPLQRSEDILAQPERRALDARQRTLLKRWSPLLLLLGLLSLALSYHLGRTLLVLQASGYRASGTVQSLETSSTSSNDTTYYPQVTFIARSGAAVRFRDRVGSNPPAYRVGEAVAVLYLPQDPGSAMIDRGIWNWIGPGIVLLAGVVLIISSLRSLSARQAAS